MRDYAISRANSQSGSAAGPLFYVQNWRARRDSESLLSASDDCLDALGITRDDIRYVLSLPWRDNVRLALEDSAFRRARSLSLSGQ
jgi:uncharacterized protein YjiS (DUF1127 family)